MWSVSTHGDGVGGAELFVLLQIKVKTQKKDAADDEEDSGSGSVVCEECGRSDRRHRLLACIQCDSGYGITVLVHFEVCIWWYCLTAPSVFF